MGLSIEGPTIAQDHERKQPRSHEPAGGRAWDRRRAAGVVRGGFWGDVWARTRAEGRDFRSRVAVLQLSISGCKKNLINQVDSLRAVATLRGLRRELPAGTVVSASQGATISERLDFAKPRAGWRRRRTSQAELDSTKVRSKLRALRTGSRSQDGHLGSRSSRPPRNTGVDETGI